MPWRLRSEPDGGNEEARPDPLYGKRNSVSPLILSVDQTSQDTARQELSNNEAHVGVGSEVDSKLKWQNFRSIGWSRCCELNMVSAAPKLGCFGIELTIPHSNPSRISPTSRTGLLGAKNTMKRKHDMTQRVQRTTLRGPKAVTSQPLMIVPKIEPTPSLGIRTPRLDRHWSHLPPP